jgi:hypothetical protein
MKHPVVALLLLFVCASSSFPAGSQSAPVGGARACVGMPEPLLRLACYDREMAAQSAAAAPVAATPVVATKAREQAPTSLRLGEEQLSRKARDADVARETRLAARVTALRELRPGLALITLDNDAQWRQEESQNGFTLAVGDAVLIKPGALGSYQMSVDKKGWTRSVRVTRVR